MVPAGSRERSKFYQGMRYRTVVLGWRSLEPLRPDFPPFAPASRAPDVKRENRGVERTAVSLVVLPA